MGLAQINRLRLQSVQTPSRNSFSSFFLALAFRLTAGGHKLHLIRNPIENSAEMILF